MGRFFDRALVLFDQSRYDLAEHELRQELADDPNNPMAHSLLALCLSERKEYQEATREAQFAIHQAPDQAFPHYALARVLHVRNRLDEAEKAIAEAIRLDPYSAMYFGRLAIIRYNQRRWPDALAAAEEGLRCDPEDVDCTNLRAMALVKLGRREEAGATIEAALARDPENAVTHANQGWALLHANEPKRAMEHFREALRLDPTLDWARAGIVEALKARHLIYGLMLRYFLWMGRLSRGAQWGVIIGGFIGYQVLRNVAEQNPALAPFIWPLLILYIVFAVMTWIASPLFNLLLRLSRFGRLALSRKQIVASNWVGGCLLAVLASLGAWLFTADSRFLLLALACGLLVMPLTAAFHCPSGWPRQMMTLYTAVLAAVGAGALTLMFADTAGWGFLLNLFLLGAFLSGFVANALMMTQPKR